MNTLIVLLVLTSLSTLAAVAETVAVRQMHADLTRWYIRCRKQVRQ